MFDLKTSIAKKQVVAITGLLLIVYLIMHLAGNLFIFAGPVWFNGYAKTLTGLRPGLYIIEVALFLVFVIHMYVTALLVLENIKARGHAYQIKKNQGERSWATRLMPYTGTFILAFVIWHVMDFTFAAHHGPRSILADGKDYGLYGVVYNSFSDPLHSILYILAMIAVGFHLAHAVQSFFQTFGFNHPRYTPIIKIISEWFGVVIAFGFSSIPIYVLINNAIA